MAKGKHSPALFEVVHGKKHSDNSASILRTPNWWFKGRHRGPVAPVMEVSERPVFTDEVDPTLRGLPSPTAEPEPAPAPPPADYESPPYDPTAFVMPQPRRGSAFQVVVDRDRQELFVRVRYTTAIVAGFAVFVLISLAYITGRSMSRGPASALATQTSEEVAAGPVEKGVLEVGGRSTATGAFTTSTPGLGTGGVSAQPAPSRPTETSTGSTGGSISVPTTGRSAAPAAPAKTPDYENGKRIVGRQYIVVQAYAGNQRALAEEARDFLLKNGVSCTVEQNVNGWPSTWHCVVSTQGFDRASGPAFEAYKAQATQIGDAFAGKSAWKRFEPAGVRWK